MKRILITLGFILTLTIATFYSGINKEKILSTLNSKESVSRQHINSKILEQDLFIIPVPFGVLVSTYEGL